MISIRFMSKLDYKSAYRMCTFVKGLCILSFLRVISSISIQGLVKSQYLYDNATFVLTQFSGQHGGLRGEGIFTRLLRQTLDLLANTFPERKLTRYCRVLSRELDKMEYKHTRKLAKHLKYLSRMYREELKEEVARYRQELDKPLKFRTEFLHAMNDVFTLRENLYFSDYVHDLKDYGNEDKLLIDEETRKLLNDVIVGSIKKLSRQDKSDLAKKLKKAIAEYETESD